MTSPRQTAPLAPGRRQRITSWFHRHLANPVMRPLSRYIPGQAVIETTGRRTGLARRTPVGGRIIGGSFWLVADHGLRSQYVRNIQAGPQVRVRTGDRWHAGTAHLLPDDDPRARLRQLPWFNSLMVRLLGTDLLTVRVDLRDHRPADDPASRPAPPVVGRQRGEAPPGRQAAGQRDLGTGPESYA